jgi:hypothetical protein
MSKRFASIVVGSASTLSLHTNVTGLTAMMFGSIAGLVRLAAQHYVAITLWTALTTSSSM